MTAAGVSQHKAETTHADKFASAAELVQPKAKSPATGGRVSPQLSCTIGVDDMAFLKKLQLQLSMKEGRIVNLSQTVRSLIALGKDNQDRLTVPE